MKNKTFSLSQFKHQLEEGDKEFIILNAQNDVIPTKRSRETEVIPMKIELSDLDDPSNKIVLDNYRMFVDFTPSSGFYYFAKALLEATRKNTFETTDLVGQKGRVKLTYYQPEGQDVSYARLNNFVFYASDQEVTQALEKMLDVEDEFELLDDDFEMETDY